MDAPDWTVVSGFAAAVSACGSLAAAWFMWRSTRDTAKVSEFGSCIEIAIRLGDAQRRVRDASEENWEFEFRELINLLEVMALLANSQNASPKTLAYVETFLIEAWAWIRS